MKTTAKTILDIKGDIEAAQWDLEIIENSIVTALENEVIVIPNIKNDPIRLALLAMKHVREELDKQVDELRKVYNELKPEGETAE